MDAQQRYLIEAAFRPNDVVAQAQKTVSEVERIMSQINTAIGGPGSRLISPEALRQAQSELEAMFRRALEANRQISPTFGSLSRADQAVVQGTTGTASTQFDVEDLKRTAAELKREIAVRKAADAPKEEIGELQAQRQRILDAAAVGQANRTLQGALTKHAQAELKAADQVERLRDADLKAASFRPTYSDVDLSTKEGSARFGVNQAERAEFVARERLAEVLNSQTRTAASEISAQKQLEAATSALATARRKVASLETESGQTRGSLRQQFAQGFRGQSDRGYAEQIGQAFKFSVFYGTAYNLLFALTQTLQETVQEGIEFQQAMSELTLATGQASDQADALGEQLGRRAEDYGFAPSQGVLAGARAVGLYGKTGADDSTQNRVADVSARVASQLAFSSGMQLDEVQTRLAAITNAFQLGFEGQSKVADLDAYMAKRFGVAPGVTVRTVAEAGTVGKAAGFDLEQVNAIAALLIGRTGESDSAIAGHLAQIFSRGGEGSLTAVASRYGIDQTQNLAQQIQQLAAVYQQASPNEQTDIAAAFGRGKVQNSAVVLLQNFQDVVDAADAAKTGAAGAGKQQADLRLDNLGGQIQQTVAVMKEFANQLGQSGLLDVLGAGVLVFREFVDAATSLLMIWNEIPGELRLTIAALVAYRAAMALTGGAGIAGSVGGLAAATPGIAARGSIIGGTLGGTAGAGIGATLLPVAAIAAAVAGLYGVAKLKDSSDQLEAAQRNARDALTSSELTPGSNADAIRGRASSLGETAKETRASTEGFLSYVKGLGTERKENLDLAGRLEAEQKRLNALADLREQTSSTTAADSTLITAFDTDSLNDSIKQITDSGGTAAGRLDALTDALLGSADAATRAAESFNADLFAGSITDQIFEALQNTNQLKVHEGTLKDVASVVIPSLRGEKKYENVLPDAVSDAISGTDIQDRLSQALAGITSLTELTPEDLQRIATSVVGDLPTQVFKGIPDSEIAGAKERWISAVEDIIRTQVTDQTLVLSGEIRLTPEELTTVLNQIVSEVSGTLQSAPETDYRTRIASVRQALAAALQVSRKSGFTDDSFEKINALRQTLVAEQLAKLEALRGVAQRQAGNEGEFAGIGRSFFSRELRVAVRGGDQDAIAQLISQAGAYGKRQALSLIETAIKVQQAAIKAHKAMLAEVSPGLLGAAYPDGIPEDFGEDGGQEDAQRLAQLRKIRRAILSTASAKKDTDVFTSGYDDGEEEADALTAAQRRAALLQANAVRSESGIAAARADLASARADMEAAEKGTSEYYSALNSFYAARNSLTDAILEYRNNRYLLGIDITDPVAQSEAALRAARAKLQSDRGKGKDVTAADRVDVRRAQADLESQKFQQRLSSIQTAEELGRVSHTKYINYLQHEHDRLNAIKNRTFQQQDQLDQIDRLMKEAAQSMDAQWNFGDIKLPTPYEVRRKVEEMFGDQKVSAKDTSPFQTQTNTELWQPSQVFINGADIGMVRKILRELVGSSVTTTTNRGRRR